MNKVAFAMVIHSHQPVGNFDHVIEEAYQKSYSPFLSALREHPGVRMTLHYSGILLEWFEKHHPEFFDELRDLSAQGQVELMSGGYYEPILASIPDAEKVAQIRKQTAYLRRHFNVESPGAWIAERVWDQGLIQPLAEAGVDYTILDDTHFLAAGMEPDQLQTTYLTEEMGTALRLVPSLQSLRYTIPFREPEETLNILRGGKGREGALFAMGDDCEKFGVWPGTYDHVYTNGWLNRFLAAIEAENDWLETTTLCAWLSSRTAEGRVYLPTASYSEMMSWALPVDAAQQLHACVEETSSMAHAARYLRFLRGGQWRNFFTKYPESNQLQKLVLRALERWHVFDRSTAQGAASRDSLKEIHDLLLAAQCNDAYWHGVFGGLYSPHLRTGLIKSLIAAESGLDKLEAQPAGSLRAALQDFDVDGNPELLLENSTFGMVVRPADGGTLSSLRFKPAGADVVNSLTRRPEAYHELVRRHFTTQSAPHQGPASIHEQVWSKESNLGALLRYDRYARHAFRSYLFPASKTVADFTALRLGENAALAGGQWELDDLHALEGGFVLRKGALLHANGSRIEIQAAKAFQVSSSSFGWQIICENSLASSQETDHSLLLGLEMVFNLLAPNSPDRYFQAGDKRYPLEHKGELAGSILSLTDEWQGVHITLKASPVARWWLAPIETISQSESGFERVYQGTAVMAIWPVHQISASERRFTLNAEIARRS